MAFANYKVCSITINSSDEIETFKKYLNPENFEFVELVPLYKKSNPNNTHWFSSACRNKEKYKCDIVVISGHFGGLFFGEKHNYILPVDLMERQACSNSCQNLLSNAQEVFLFGCNTLASKNQNQRTPEEYLDVLLHYNMAPDLAETVVATRYLPFGLSFQDQMRFVFSNPSSSLYGFSALSPLGKDIRRPLANYFEKINQQYGSYASYLKQKNKSPETKNAFLRKTISGTISETKGLGPEDKQYPQFQKMCRLYQDDIEVANGMKEIESLIKSGNGPMAYSAIKYFMSKNHQLKGPSLEIFEALKNSAIFKQDFYSLYSQIGTHLPYMRIQFLNFLNFFNWVSESFYEEELKINTLAMIKKPDSESYDFIISLRDNERDILENLNLQLEDFRSDFFQNVWSVLILEVLNVRNYKIHRRLMNTCLSQINEDIVICYQVLKTLGHLKVNDSLTVQAMEDLLKGEHKGLIYYTIYGLASSGIQLDSTHLAIARHFNHENPWIQRQAIRAAGKLKVQHSEVNQQLVTKISSLEDEQILRESLRSLYNMRPSISRLRQIIRKRELYDHENPEIRQLSQGFF